MNRMWMRAILEPDRWYNETPAESLRDRRLYLALLHFHLLIAHDPGVVIVPVLSGLLMVLLKNRWTLSFSAASI